MGYYSIGQLFQIDKGKYPHLLVQTGNGAINLIGLGDGGFNRFTNETKVEDIYNITSKELNTLVGHGDLKRPRWEYICEFPLVKIDGNWKTSAVKRHILDNKKVAAIKIARGLTGGSLRECKDNVEQWGYDLGVWPLDGKYKDGRKKVKATASRI